MFNLKKQEIIIMKKYIAPICEKYEVLPESNIMAMSATDGYADKDGFEQYSNERQSASGSIWDQEY